MKKMIPLLALAILVSGCGIPNDGDDRVIHVDEYPVDLIVRELSLPPTNIPNFTGGSSYSYQKIISQAELDREPPTESLLVTIYDADSTDFDAFVQSYRDVTSVTWRIDDSVENTVYINNGYNLTAQAINIQAALDGDNINILFEKLNSVVSRVFPGEINPFSGEETFDIFEHWVGSEIPAYNRGTLYNYQRGVNESGRRTVMLGIYGIYILDGSHTAMIEDYVKFMESYPEFVHTRTPSYSAAGICLNIVDEWRKVEGELATVIRITTSSSAWQGSMMLHVWSEPVTGGN